MIGVVIDILLLHVLFEYLKHIPMTSPSFLHMPMDVLQSQLFILRLMSACMQHDWNNTLTTPSIPPLLPTQKDDRLTNNNDSSTVLPSPLDEALVSFILNILQHFLNLMQMVEEANDLSSSSESSRYLESTSTASMTSSTMASSNSTSGSSSGSGVDSSNSININSGSNRWTAKPVDPKLSGIVLQLYQVTGSILHYISACNWLSYYSKIKAAVQKMGASIETSDNYFSELRLFEFAHLDKQTLHLVFTGKHRCMTYKRHCILHLHPTLLTC